jgi:hypothetical protein
MASIRKKVASIRRGEWLRFVVANGFDPPRSRTGRRRLRRATHHELVGCADFVG